MRPKEIKKLAQEHKARIWQIQNLFSRLLTSSPDDREVEVNLSKVPSLPRYFTRSPKELLHSALCILIICTYILIPLLDHKLLEGRINVIILSSSTLTTKLCALLTVDRETIVFFVVFAKREGGQGGLAHFRVLRGQTKNEPKGPKMISKHLTSDPFFYLFWFPCSPRYFMMLNKCWVNTC